MPETVRSNPIFKSSVSRRPVGRDSLLPGRLLIGLFPIGLILAVCWSWTGVLLPGQAWSAEKGLTDQAKGLKVESMYDEYKKSFPEVEDLTAEEAMELMKSQDLVFVDVRQPEEQAVSMLPGAITDKEFLRNHRAYHDQLVVVYCTISYRSGKLARKLSKEGIDVFNLRGGILAWLHAGGRVYREGQPVNQVHVFGRKWDLAPSAFESIR
jgi:sodium/bile acid cotransporter 7